MQKNFCKSSPMEKYNVYSTLPQTINEERWLGTGGGGGGGAINAIDHCGLFFFTLLKKNYDQAKTVICRMFIPA